MSNPRHHQDLVVWQRSIDLAVSTYPLVRGFPLEDRIAIGAQIRRAAISVPANIAEGAGRVHRRDSVQFRSFSRGSVEEVVTLLEMARRLELAKSKELVTIDELLDHIRKMLTALMRTLTRTRIPNPRHSSPVTRH